MSIFHSYTEGGQTTTHRVRMFKQVFLTSTKVSLLVALSYFIYLMMQVSSIYYMVLFYDFNAEMEKGSKVEISVDSETWSKISKQFYNTKRVKVSYEKLTYYTKPIVDQFYQITEKNLLKSSWVLLASYGLIFLFFVLKTEIQKRSKHISGMKLSSAWKINWMLKLKRQASNFRIGKLHLVKGTETQHILITGGTGSGKTNCIHHILSQIRTLRQRAVIIDTTGIYRKRYFRPGKDILLNPTDDEALSWHPWIECEDETDFDALTENFIPNSNHEQENYWRSAARSLFSSLLKKIKNSEKTSDLTKWVLFESLHKLCLFLEGTEAAAHIDIASEKTAASVRSVASSFLKCLKYVKDTESPFSIKEWVKNEKNDDSWLFLACDPGKRAAFVPLISCWFSIAARSLLKTQPDFNRRLWFVLDELPTLNKLRELEPLLAESRKYGGCALIALQSPAQLEDIYGRATCRTILGLCATKIIFSELDAETAERISKSLGIKEFKEVNESVSYGAHEMRDGVNLSAQIKQQPLVSASAIHALKANQCYVKLFGNIPVAKIKLKIVSSA